MNLCENISQRESDFELPRPFSWRWIKTAVSLSEHWCLESGMRSCRWPPLTYFVCLCTCNQHTTRRQTYLLSLTEKQNDTLFINPLNKKHLFPIPDTTSLDNSKREKKTILNTKIKKLHNPVVVFFFYTFAVPSPKTSNVFIQCDNTLTVQTSIVMLGNK